MKRLFVVVVALMLSMLTISTQAASSDQRDALVRVASAEEGTRYYNSGTGWNDYYIGDDCKYNTWFYDEYYKRVIQGLWKSDEAKSEAVHQNMWCATFVCWCANQAGIGEDEIPFDSNVNSIKSWYDGRGRYQPGMIYTPKAGDLIFFYDGSQYSHIGIVIGCEQRIHAPMSNEMKLVVTTIEGDCIDGSYSTVAKKTYERYENGTWNKSAIAGFGEN